jgi:transposase-like protein
MAMNKQRKRYSPQEKVRILREHLIEKATVSDICDRHGLSPNVFYRWQKEFFENGAAAFEFRRGGNGRERKLQAQVGQLQSKLAQKDEVIAEIMASHVQLKKELGEL